MAKLKLTGVAGTDTESEFTLTIDGVLINHSLITRARLVLIGSALALDSSIYPGAWDFSNAGKLIVRLGRGDLITGRYRGLLVTHDVNHANGLHWDTELEINII